MTRILSAAEAKNHFSEVVHRVAFAHERVVIERRGKPLAVVVSLEDLKQLEAQEKKSPAEKRAKGLVSCAGLFKDMPEVSEALDEVVRERRRETGPPPISLE